MPPKPVRYWPGKAPEGYKSSSSSDEEDNNTIQDTRSSSKHYSIQVSHTRTQDKRDDVNSDQRSRGRRRSSDDDDEEEEDDEEFRRRRNRVKRRDEDEEEVDLDHRDRRQRRRDDEDEEVGDGKDHVVSDEIGEKTRKRIREPESEESGSSSTDEEDSSEYTSSTESEDELPVMKPLFKPVFVPKLHRATILEKERLEKEALEAEERRIEELEERKKESAKLVEEEIKREIAAKNAVTDSNEPPDVDDTDGLDETEEFESWRLRELKRIQRDRQERRAREIEAAEIERRRNMTDEELMKEKIALGEIKEKEHGDRGFLQKYYHKGAFYQDQEILSRDYSAPTLEDKFDRSVLPEVMQVRNFGKAGRTKWTHLAKEDTSKKDAAWAKDTDVNKRVLNRMGGMKSSSGFEKPTAKKRRNE